jgi:hypothetical protein
VSRDPLTMDVHHSLMLFGIRFNEIGDSNSGEHD